jgi:hemerythrin-like domain-containing protein
MAKRKAKSSKSKYPAAITMLIEDHQKVRKLFKQFEKLNGDETEKHSIVEKACQELTVHAQLEEELFYPALRDALEEGELVDEAEVEHQVAKQLIQQLQEAQPDDPQYSAKFTVLSEYVNHHIEEEEGEIFKEAKKSDIDFEQLAQDMEQRKQELMQKLGAEEAESARPSKGRNERDAESKRSRSRAGHRA